MKEGLNWLRARKCLKILLAMSSVFIASSAFAQGGPPASGGSIADRVAVLEQAVGLLQAALNQEIANRMAADTAEANARIAADAAEVTARNNAISVAVAAEASIRSAADTAETNARIAADNAEISARNSAIADAVGVEASARTAADLAESNARQSADTAETSARTTADAGLQGQIDGLASDTVAGLGQYVSVVDLSRDVDRDGIDDDVPTIRFSGVNVQIVNGMASCMGPCWSLNSERKRFTGVSSATGHKPGLSVVVVMMVSSVLAS